MAEVLATVESRPAIWAMPQGKGWVIVAAGGDEATFNELVRDAVYNLSKLDATKRDALEVDTDWDGVYATLLANGEVILYNFTSEPRVKTVAGTTVTLPPHSLRSVLVKRPSRWTCRGFLWASRGGAWPVILWGSEFGKEGKGRLRRRYRQTVTQGGLSWQ